MRERVALILLYLSWPVCVVHRYWNNEPERKVRWIRYDRSVFQDFRWYWVYNELWVSAFFVILSFLIIRRKTRKLQIALWGLFWVSVVDILNYWLFFRRNEYALSLEGLIMVATALITIYNDQSTRKSYHEKAT
jgi:hypothetical protein